jgi:predicted GNAT superfamily acetyltransferase
MSDTPPPKKKSGSTKPLTVPEKKKVPQSEAEDLSAKKEHTKTSTSDEEKRLQETAHKAIEALVGSGASIADFEKIIRDPKRSLEKIREDGTDEIFSVVYGQMH